MEFQIRKAVLANLSAYFAFDRMILVPHNHLVTRVEIQSIVDDGVSVRAIPTESNLVWFHIQLGGDEGPYCLDGEHKRLDPLLDGNFLDSSLEPWRSWTAGQH